MELEWSQKSYAKRGIRSYFSDQLKLFLDNHDTFPDMQLKIHDDTEDSILDKKCFLSRSYKQFIDCEEAGTITSYRCHKCRNCKECKCGPSMEEINRKEECEQYAINQSVKFDAEEKKLYCV